MDAPIWLPRTPAEISSRAQPPYHLVTLTELATAFTEVAGALFLARNDLRPHPGDGAELAELALGAAIARDVSAGRGVRIRAALVGGASWGEVAEALDVTEGAAREVFTAWINGQSHYYAENGRFGLSPEEEAAARHLLAAEPTS